MAHQFLRTIDSVKFKHLELTEPETVVLALGSRQLAPGAASPDLTAFPALPNAYLYTFDGVNIRESLTGQFILPYNWVEGTTLVFDIRWMPTDNTKAGNVLWQISYTFADKGETFPSSILITRASTKLGAWVNTHASFDPVDLPLTARGASLIFSLTRDPNHTSDTYQADAMLIDVAIKLKAKSIGAYLPEPSQ